MDISGINGIGTKTYELLHKLNIYTVDDLINYYPYRYNVIKVIPLVEAEDGEVVTIKGIVDTEPRVSYIKKNLNKLSFRLNSDGILVNVTIFNRAFYKQHLHVGRMINLIGKYERKNNTFTASDIKFEIINDIDNLYNNLMMYYLY